MAKAIVPKAGTGAPGQAMAELTPKQQKFVRAMLETGGHNHMRCAQAAGFTGNANTLRVTGHRLAHDTKVLAALREEADKRIRTGAVLGASVLLEIAGNPTHKDRYKAAVELLNRSGLQVVTEHKVTVDRGGSEKQMIDRIGAMATQLGIDPKQLLGGFIDATFEEVKPKELEAPFDPNAGLEDLL